jgi:hypothetical protein
MVAGRLGSNSDSSGYFMASGEATPQAKLPEQYVPVAHRTDSIASRLNIPPDWNGNVRRQPIVQRAQRTAGMRYLYARGAVKMPIQNMGADGIPQPGNGRFQPNFQGSIHNAGFNWKLFQAGYPGYNLGLSFKVENQTTRNEVQTGGPGYNMRATGPQSLKMNSTQVNRLNRGTGRSKSSA